MERQKYVNRKDDKHTYAICIVVIFARYTFIQHVNVCYAGETNSVWGKMLFWRREYITYKLTAIVDISANTERNEALNTYTVHYVNDNLRIPGEVFL